MATIYISFSLLICGFYIRIRDMTLSVVRGLTWVSFSKYSFQGLAITELQNRVWEDPTCQPLTTGTLPFVPTCFVLLSQFKPLFQIFGIHSSLQPHQPEPVCQN